MDSNNESYHYSKGKNAFREYKNFGNTTNSSKDKEMSTIQDFIEAQRLDSFVGL